MHSNPDKKFKKVRHPRLSRKWIIAGSLLLSGLLVFLVIGATRSSEIDASSQKLEVRNQSLNAPLPTVNYTDLFAQQLTNEIMAQLPEIAPENASSVIEALKQVNLSETEKSLKKIDPQSVFGTAVADADIFVTTDDSKETLLNYINDLEEIVAKTQRPLYSALAKIDLKAKPDGKNDSLIKFSQMAANSYQEAFNKIKNLIAPSLIAEQHKKELAIALEMQRVFTAMANYEQDPVKAALGLVYLKQLGQQGAEVEQETRNIVYPIFFGK